MIWISSANTENSNAESSIEVAQVKKDSICSANNEGMSVSSADIRKMLKISQLSQSSSLR